MARPLAALLSFSFLVFFAPACADVATAPLLTDEQLEQPAQVSAWLKQHAANADKQTAKEMYQFGLKEMKRNSYDSATKAFGDSAIRFPTPQALNAYADARLRGLGGIREHNKNRSEHLDRDLRHVESIYRSALASDATVPAMSEQERVQTKAYLDCMVAYRRDRSGVATCPPLAAYGLR